VLAASVLYILLRTITDIWKYIIYAVAFLISGYSIGFVLAIIFACSPVAKSWDPTITNGSCIDVKAIYLGSVVTNTASDVILILIAVPIVWKLRLPFLQRLGVITLFGVGCLLVLLKAHMPINPSITIYADILLKMSQHNNYQYR
jgi:hypothetical protein